MFVLYVIGNFVQIQMFFFVFVREEFNCYYVVGIYVIYNKFICSFNVVQSGFGNGEVD